MSSNKESPDLKELFETISTALNIPVACVVILGGLIGCFVFFTGRQSLQTPTKQVTSVVSPSPTSTVQPAPSDTPYPTTVPSPVFLQYDFFIKRNHDNVAVCALQAVNLSTLELWFNSQTLYKIGDIFPEVENSTEGQCWCLQLEDAVLFAPNECIAQNHISIEEKVADWRNANIRVDLNDTPIGMCAAQPNNEGFYECR